MFHVSLEKTDRNWGKVHYDRPFGRLQGVRVVTGWNRFIELTDNWREYSIKKNFTAIYPKLLFEITKYHVVVQITVFSGFIYLEYELVF